MRVKWRLRDDWFFVRCFSVFIFREENSVFGFYFVGIFGVVVYYLGFIFRKESVVLLVSRYVFRFRRVVNEFLEKLVIIRLENGGKDLSIDRNIIRFIMF